MIWHALTALWLLSLPAILAACRSAPTLVRVSGNSMLPTLHEGQYVTIDTKTWDFAVGDVGLISRP